MRIILSGGWGYNNLGDDAILLSTIEILNRQFNNPDITVITNDVVEAEIILCKYNNIRINKSIYDTLFNNKSNIVNRYFFLRRVYNKIYKYLYPSNMIRKFSRLEYLSDEIVKRIKDFESIFIGADIYIMAGGGYLADWTEMNIEKNVESLLARKHNLKLYMIGQTIGPFKYNSNRKLVMNICNRMDNIVYRDDESILESKKYNIKCIDYSIPDLALYTEYNNVIKEDYIVFIPFLNDIKHNVEIISKNVKKIALKKNAKVIVCTSQIWECSINNALISYNTFKRNGIMCSLIIPNNVFDLQNILSKAKLVISQNLHGLILSYRAQTNIISLNNRRKFKTFMKSTGLSKNIIEPADIIDDELFNLSENNTIHHKSFSNDIINTLNDFFI